MAVDRPDAVKGTAMLAQSPASRTKTIRSLGIAHPPGCRALATKQQVDLVCVDPDQCWGFNRTELASRRQCLASANALFNSSKLAVWWLRLGIQIERIKPGRFQQNGRHERMYLTLKREATRPPGMNSFQQRSPGCP